jgi:hypothetical protein
MSTDDVNTNVENDEDYFFSYSASLRISGDDLDFELITKTLDLLPTHMHRKGDQGKIGEKYKQDMWLYEVNVPDESALDEHLQALWALLKPYKEFLLSLKEKYHLDIFCGYRSNCSTAGFAVLPQSLDIFLELDIPFGVSIIVF